MSEQAPDVVKELVKRIDWTCPTDVTTMKFVAYTIDKRGLDLTVVLSCPKCGKRIWIRWRYEMDGDVKQERTVNDDDMSI